MFVYSYPSPLAGSLITSGVLSPLSLFFERSFCYSNLCKWLCITYLMLCFLGGVNPSLINSLGVQPTIFVKCRQAVARER